MYMVGKADQQMHTKYSYYWYVIEMSELRLVAHLSSPSTSAPGHLGRS
jgi:hypothetical protein